MDVDAICDELEAVYAAGHYPELTVERPWSQHNPLLHGEFARPAALRGYLRRELTKLANRGARLAVRASRPAVSLGDPAHFAGVNEDDAEPRAKKLFLFSPERTELSLDRLAHYTGTPAEAFQRYVLFTNYAMHVDAFRAMFPDATGPARDGVQMPAWHHAEPDHGDGGGISLVNIGVGPSNAKTITDHLAVLRPDVMLMVGHCGGLRNHQAIGDMVLATAYLRDDRVLDEMLPLHVPVVPNLALNRFLLAELDRQGLPYRLGTVFTTANRNWEFHQELALSDIRLSRAVAVDMESATIAANGYRYRIPSATLLCVSDKPLHGAPKLTDAAQDFYRTSKELHLQVAVDAIRNVRSVLPGGLPAADLRAPDEPLFGSVD